MLLTPPKEGNSLLHEGADALREVPAGGHLLLDLRLQLELLLQPGVHAGVELALAAGIGARGALGQVPRERLGGVGQLGVGHDAVDQAPVERGPGVQPLAQQRQLGRAGEADPGGDERGRAPSGTSPMLTKASRR